MGITSTIFNNLAETFTVKLGTDLFHNVSSLISSIAPIFSLCFGIYMLLVALNAYNRGLDENILDLSKRMIGWLIIIACAFNAIQYIKIANLIYNMPEDLASVFGSHSSNVAGAFDASAEKLTALQDKLLELDKSYNILQVGSHFIMNAVVIGPITICGWVLLGVSFAYYVVAKVSLALILMLGPIFIGCMLFPATRQYCMNWIGACFNYVLTVVMFTILSNIQTAYFDSLVTDFSSRPLDNIAGAVLLPGPFIVMTFLFLIVAWNIPSITSALTGGASIGGFAQGFRNTAGITRALGTHPWNGTKAAWNKIRGPRNNIKDD